MSSKDKHLDERMWYWRVLRFPLTRIVLWTPLILLGGYLPVVLVMAGFGVEVADAGGTQMLAAACFAPPGAAFVYWLLVHFVERRSMSDLRRHGAMTEFGIGAAVGAALISVIVAIIALCGGYRITGVQPPLTVTYALGIAVVSGFVEEFIMRGLVYRITEESLGTWIAVIVSAILFGSLHAIHDGATLLGCVSIGLAAGPMMAFMYVLTRRLWMCIGLHVAWNFALVGIYGAARSDNHAPSLLVSERRGPEFISGGSFGAEGSVVTMLVTLTLSAVLCAVAVRRERLVRFGRR